MAFQAVVDSPHMHILHKRRLHKILVIKEPQSRLQILFCRLPKVFRLLQPGQSLTGNAKAH